MSIRGTIAMSEAFEQNSFALTNGLSRMFKTYKGNVYSAEKLEKHIKRAGEPIEIAVKSYSSGYRELKDEQFTIKDFTAPVYKTMFTVDPWHGLDRVQFGKHAYEGNADVAAYVLKKTMENADRVLEMYDRNIELQAAQVLQTGIITSVDADSNEIYSIDFKMKSTHKITAGTAWSDAGADILGDLNTACKKNRTDGQVKSKMAILGEGSYKALIANTAVKVHIDQRRAESIEIPRMKEIDGLLYRGWVNTGNYELALYTYEAEYLDPETAANVQYLDDDKVIVMGDIRLEKTFGKFPVPFVEPDPRLMKFLPGSLSFKGGENYMHVNAWFDQANEALRVGLGMRPLLIPTQIDGYSAISTGV